MIKGTYLSFLDSDDVFADGSIQKMLDAAFKFDAEILQGSWYTFTEERIEDYPSKREHLKTQKVTVKTNCNGQASRRENHIVSKEGVVNDNSGVFSGFPWGKLYKYNVMKNFSFPEGFWFEDTPISFLIAAMPYRCVAIKDFVYGYRLHPDSISAQSRKKKRSVESYWVTEKCIEEFPKFGLKYDQRAYEYLLRQSLMNEKRTRSLPFKIREAEFVLTAEIMDKYFEGNVTNDNNMRKIEKSLRRRQFLRFDLLSMR